MTWSVWMQVPATSGWSRVVGNLTQAEAERFSECCLFPARAMPDESKEA